MCWEIRWTDGQCSKGVVALSRRDGANVWGSVMIISEPQTNERKRFAIVSTVVIGPLTKLSVK